MHYIKYTKYPNNEIRAVHYYRAIRESSEGHSAEAEGPDEPLVAPDREVSVKKAEPSYLDISNDFAHSGESKVRKRTKFGLRAKRTLLRLGGAYDTLEKDPSKFIFLTGTIPGGTHEAFQAVAEESAYITRAIADWLRRTAPCEHWFYVWELQKRGALHIHYCVYPTDSSAAEKILTGFKGKWQDILDTVSLRRNVNVWVRKDGTVHKEGKGVLQAYSQRVQKSVAAYLSGYCGGAKDKHSADASSQYFPTRWWGYSRKSAELLRSLTEEVVVEHTNYRDARKEMLYHYEAVLHDGVKAYQYRHKAGIGSTCVSYHPQDKGNLIWRSINPMLYKMETHKSTASTIALYQTLTRDTTYLLEACPVRVQNSFKPLLMTLRGCSFPAPVYGYSIARRDLRVISMIPSSLNSPLCIVPEWERLRLQWVLLQDSVAATMFDLCFDKYGYVCNEVDILRLLDNHWSWRYLSTTDPKRSGATSGGANGSISPQPPLTPEQLCLFSD